MATTKRGKRIALAAGFVLLALAVLIGVLYHDELRSWYVFWQDFESLGKNAQGYSEYRHRKTGIVFVALPGGEFWMGTSEEEGEGAIEEAVKELEGARKGVSERIATEQPRHKVTLSPFLIAKYEVSQAEWESVMGSNPSRFKADDLPVENVSWNDIQEFEASTGVVLPTEAQWEYACRAGTNTPLASEETLSKAQANFRGAKKTVDVDSFEPDGVGLYNMHGNVLEWCEDVYDAEFYREPGASHKNPVSASGSVLRVLRGGGWLSHAWRCRAAFRGRYRPSVRRQDLGFRPTWSSP